MGIVEDFNSYRSRMNDKIMESDIVIPHLRRAFEFLGELQHV
ncbi:MAG: hypothetical protein WD824_22875 [Cyclobacteriaceae bacterium]